MAMDLEDRIRFLVETHYHEVAAFWIRTNVFLVVMAAGLAAIVATKDEHVVQLVIALLGFVAAAAWWQVNRMSHYYQARWIEAARQIVCDPEHKNSKELQPYFGPLCRDASARPSGPGATKVVYVIIVAFGAAWLTLAARALFGLFCGGDS